MLPVHKPSMARLMPTRSPLQPIPATVDEVRERLSSRILTLRSIWFPSPRDLRNWKSAQGGLYLRWLGADRFEVGPRLGSMWAACFSPVVEGTLQVHNDHVTCTLRQRFPAITTGLLSLWSVTLTVWLVVLVWNISAHDEPVIWLLWWGILAASTVAAPLVGSRLGGAELDIALPQLDDAVRQPLVEEDW